MSVRVKICGITRVDDALAAVDAGADAIGLNFWPQSKRFIALREADRIAERVPPFVTVVGVFVNAPLAEVIATANAVGLSAVQLHGDESAAFAAKLPLPVIKAVRVESRASLKGLAKWKRARLLLDAATPGYGGSGTAFDWSLARAVAQTRDIILAGGLDPKNVAQAVEQVRPWAVDVASGVERSPGVKDHRKLQNFIKAAKRTPSPSGRGWG